MKFEEHGEQARSSWPPRMAGDARLAAPSIGKMMVARG